MLTMADLIACLLYTSQVNRHWQYLLYKYIDTDMCVCQIYVV